MFTEIKKLADKYNHPKYFETDPIIFPRHFASLYYKGKVGLQDIEISALLCAHIAWGRREMIVKNCSRLMDEMQWEPYNYVMKGIYRNDNSSLHRTIKWYEIATIMGRLKEFYMANASLETLSVEEMRVNIFGSKPNPRAANKKIHMMRRWMVRDDNKVDIGVWKNSSPTHLIIPLDVHVHRNALKMGITTRKNADIITALEITNYFKQIYPNDPCKGDFALFTPSASGTQK